ncbi:MAG: hypothetical protein IPO58_06910 [Betaproteobacteria bacterium]|nr:hypothetical protein [Betaproteobacteria bacterium]
MNPAASLRRIGALVLRHVAAAGSRGARVISLAYYPTVTMICVGLHHHLPGADQ